MRYNYIHSDGRRSNIDTELTITHVVLGQRDATEELKKLPPKEKMVLTPEEYAIRQKFVSEDNAGKYQHKVLAWAGSPEEADALVEKFKAEGRINIEVKQINPLHVLAHV